MTGTEILIAVACFAAGFAIAWLWTRGSAGAGRLELERRAAGLDGAGGELKKQTETLQQDLRGAQKRIEDEQKLRSAAEKDAEAQRSNLTEQRRILDEAQVTLKEAFQSLAGEALQASSRQFIDLAKAKFDSLQKEAEGDLEQRKVAIQAMVNPLETALRDLRPEVTRVESAKHETYLTLPNDVHHLPLPRTTPRRHTATPL